MGTNSSGEIDVSQSPNQNWVVNIHRLELMQQKISSHPKLLSKTGGGSSCFIFRTPPNIAKINGRAHYQPQIISIGPYHRGKAELRMMEEHKWRLLGNLLTRTESHGLTLPDLLKAVQELENQARVCYIEYIEIGIDEFVEMMVLDGCFLIEVLRFFGGVIPFDKNDPIYSMDWVYSLLLTDLIRLENQIPFFVLQRLFDLTNFGDNNSGPNLSTLVIRFFNPACQRPERIFAEFSNLEGKHLLDVLRSSYILPGFEEPKEITYYPLPHVIHNISELRRVGMRFKCGEEENFLAMRFKHGVIEIPQILINEFMSVFLYNCVAYEQCHRGFSKQMTTYALVMDSLIETTTHVKFLIDHKIFENCLGTEADVAKFISSMGKCFGEFDPDSCYLGNFLQEVDDYYRKRSVSSIGWTSFKDTFFSTPWWFVPAVVASALLILSILQTVYTILGYVHPSN